MNDVAINIDHLLDLAGAVCDEIATENDFAAMDAVLLADQLPVAATWIIVGRTSR